MGLAWKDFHPQPVINRFILYPHVEIIDVTFQTARSVSCRARPTKLMIVGYSQPMKPRL